MDLFRLIKDDHDHINQLLSQLSGEALPLEPDFSRTFSQLRLELDSHEMAELEVFFPIFGQNDQGRELVSRAQDCANSVTSYLADLEEAGLSSERRNELLTELHKALKGDQDLEVAQMFPLARQFISEQQAEQLGMDWQASKQRYFEAHNYGYHPASAAS